MERFRPRNGNTLHGLQTEELTLGRGQKNTSVIKCFPKSSLLTLALNGYLHKLSGRMSNLVRDQLPPTFRSLYRLVLRATSASVLHHTAATRSLRALWKPTFHGATDVIRRLQSGAADVAEQQKLENWLMIWERRSKLIH